LVYSCQGLPTKKARTKRQGEQGKKNDSSKKRKNKRPTGITTTRTGTMTKKRLDSEMIRTEMPTKNRNKYD